LLIKPLKKLLFFIFLYKYLADCFLCLVVSVLLVGSCLAGWFVPCWLVCGAGWFVVLVGLWCWLVRAFCQKCTKVENQYVTLKHSLYL